MFDQDFREFLKSLNDNHVRYLIIGGYAVAYHGHPRYTKDLDVWVASDKENAARIVKALDDFGFASLGLKEEDFLDPNQVIQLGYPPNRIDMLTSTMSLDFETCFPKREQVEMDGVQVSFIDLENLKKNKKAVGRHQDLADIEHLK